MPATGDNQPSGATSDGLSVYRNARLLISCPDRPGIVAAVSSFLFEHGANIVSSDQHSTDPEGGRFFMRMEFSTADMDLGRDQLEAAFEADVARALRDALADVAPGRPQAHGDPRLALRALRPRPALAMAARIDRRGRGAGRLEPPGSRGGRALLRGAVPPRARAAGWQDAGGGEAPRAARGRGRRGGARSLHADSLRRLHRPDRGAADQHPPLLPAGVRRRRIPTGRPTRRASRSSAPRPTTWSRNSMRGRSSSRTSRASRTASRLRT